MEDIGDPIVRDSLCFFATFNQISLDTAEKLFFTSDGIMYEMIMSMINMKYPYHYKKIGYCKSCNKFYLIKSVNKYKK